MSSPLSPTTPAKCVICDLSFAKHHSYRTFREGDRRESCDYTQYT